MRTVTILPIFHSSSAKTTSGKLQPRTELFESHVHEGPSVLLLRRALERPLYVRANPLGNLVSAAMIFGTLALLAALAYIATVVFANFYVLTQSHGILVR